jgi:hypothetical protein
MVHLVSRLLDNSGLNAIVGVQESQLSNQNTVQYGRICWPWISRSSPEISEEGLCSETTLQGATKSGHL